MGGGEQHRAADGVRTYTKKVLSAQRGQGLTMVQAVEEILLQLTERKGTEDLRQEAHPGYK
jgi:hypothetical protein